jgi:hypothetical protein
MGKTDEPNAPAPADDDAPAAPQSDEECDATVTISPPKEKVGEDEDNLGRREEWFRKRGGK